MNRKKLLKIVEWVWIGLVLIGVGYYLSKNFNQLTAYLHTLPLYRLIISILLLFVAKIFLAKLSCLAAQGEGLSIPLKRMYLLNGLIQLAKYLPGGIWHFVGRVGYYRANDLSLKKASRAMIVENIWLVSSAIFVGGIAILPYEQGFLCKFVPGMSGCQSLVVPLGITIVLIGWALSIGLVERFGVGDRPRDKVRFGFTLALAQAGAWIIMGLSFWTLIPQAGLGEIKLAIGSFGLSWAAGYLTIFAPGGIGIRELGLTTLLSILFSPTESIVYAMVSRFVWIVAEILVGLAAGLAIGFNQIPLSSESQAGFEAGDLKQG